MCIRPQTYESESEAEVLTWLYSDRAGTLRNTSFGILSSDGERKLSETGRSPSMIYGTAELFAEALREIADEQGTTKRESIAALPALPDLRLALGVAAADLRPLVVLFAADAKEREALVSAVQAAAWSEELVGRFRYLVVESEDELAGFEELGLRPGLSVLQAEAYGRDGEVLARADAPRAPAEVAELLATALPRFDATAKDVRQHLRRGEREGIEWETAIEVTDPGRGSGRGRGGDGNRSDGGKRGADRGRPSNTDADED